MPRFASPRWTPAARGADSSDFAPSGQTNGAPHTFIPGEPRVMPASVWGWPPSAGGATTDATGNFTRLVPVGPAHGPLSRADGPFGRTLRPSTQCSRIAPDNAPTVPTNAPIVPTNTLTVPT